MSTQIDEVSRVIGGIERYIHDNQHAIANVNQAIIAASDLTTRQIKEMDKQLNARINELDDGYRRTVEASLTSVKVDITNLTLRMIALETENSNRRAVVKFTERVATIPGLMWLLGIGVAAASYMIGKFGGG